jgi:hypothetical protein
MKQERRGGIETAAKSDRGRAIRMGSRNAVVALKRKKSQGSGRPSR